MFKLREIADRLSGGVDGSIYNQVRGLHQRGSLKSAGLRGGEHQFAETELHVAAILVAAVQAGVEGGDLDRLESEVRNGRTVVFPATGNYRIDLESNIARIAVGEQWEVECARSRCPVTGAHRFAALWVRILPGGQVQRFGRHHPDPRRPGVETADGQPIDSVLTIPVASIIGRQDVA